MRTITVQKPTRIFERHHSIAHLLCHMTLPGTDKYLGVLPGDTITIGDTMPMVYDHINLVAAPIITPGYDGTFILLRDFPELTNYE